MLSFDSTTTPHWEVKDVCTLGRSVGLKSAYDTAVSPQHVFIGSTQTASHVLKVCVIYRGGFHSDNRTTRVSAFQDFVQRCLH